jgi:hypothetical protein
MVSILLFHTCEEYNILILFLTVSLGKKSQNRGGENRKTGQTVINMIVGTLTIFLITAATAVAKSLCNWFFTIESLGLKSLSHVFLLTL